MKNKILILLVIIVFCSPEAFASRFWNNTLTNKFLTNNAVIYAINIRTFNAQDKDGDGIIDESKGEIKGNFLNAIERLDELSASGINTVQLLPILPVGKTKAIGTAGSLYAPTSFNQINPQLKDKKSKLSAYEQMEKFVQACHDKNISVIVDLPCCASYDLYLKNPSLFVLDENQNPIIPSDWTDVRLLNAGSESEINPDVYQMYSKFIRMMIDLGVDGIRANAPQTKPALFWNKLITEAKSLDPQFLFIAETTKENKKISDSVSNTSLNNLLKAGFDGYYGDYNNISSWTKANDLYSAVKADLALSKKYEGNKKVLGNFATHNQISPVLSKGAFLSKMIIWLDATLPLNTYYIDGFPTGDTYLYPKINKKALKSETDDDYYFVHRGQLDIFNYSRVPIGEVLALYKDYLIANKLKSSAQDIISSGSFVPLRTTDTSVFAYARSFKKRTIIVVGNLDFRSQSKVNVSVPKLTNSVTLLPVEMVLTPVIKNGKIEIELMPGEIQVYLLDKFEIK